MDSEKSKEKKDAHKLMQRSRQLDPQHDNYWKSRGYPERPDNWEALVKKTTKPKS